MSGVRIKINGRVTEFDNVEDFNEYMSERHGNKVSENIPIYTYTDEKEIGLIGNYYGGLFTCRINDKPFWGIENYDGVFWEPISEELYKCINSHRKADPEDCVEN